MSTISQDDIIRHLETLTSAELGEIIALLEERLGVRAQPQIAPSTTLTGASMGEMVGGPDSFSVHVLEVGPNKIQVIAAVRKRLGLGLLAAKELVDSAPVRLLDEVDGPTAEAFASELKAAGAKVGVR